MINCQIFGAPFLGLRYNPYTSPLFGYGLGPQYSSLIGSWASRYIYGPVGPFDGLAAYRGFPGGYGIFNGLGPLGSLSYGLYGLYGTYSRRRPLALRLASKLSKN